MKAKRIVTKEKRLPIVWVLAPVEAILPAFFDRATLSPLDLRVHTWFSSEYLVRRRNDKEYCVRSIKGGCVWNTDAGTGKATRYKMPEAHKQRIRELTVNRLQYELRGLILGSFNATSATYYQGEKAFYSMNIYTALTGQLPKENIDIDPHNIALYSRAGELRDVFIPTDRIELNFQQVIPT